jgi:hypothetical protein
VIVAHSFDYSCLCKVNKYKQTSNSLKEGCSGKKSQPVIFSLINFDGTNKRSTQFCQFEKPRRQSLFEKQKKSFKIAKGALED